MACDHDLAKEIRDVISLTADDAFEPGASVVYKLTTWLCELSDAVHAVACKWEDGDLSELEAPAVDAALAVWDGVIVPIDMPRVPEIFEKMLEGQIRSAIPAMVASAFARIK